MEISDRYYDFDPAKAVVFLLLEMFGVNHIKIVTFFKMPNSSTPAFTSVKNGKFKILDKKIGTNNPDRSSFKEKIRIQKINNQAIVKAELNPQRTLLDEGNSNNIIVLRFYNPTDDNWDFVFILIDQKLINAVGLKSEAAGWKMKNRENSASIIRSYFNIVYPYMAEIVRNEYRKFEYTKELIQTLEKTILLKTNLEKHIEELRKSRKSDLVTKVNAVLENKALELNKEVKLSEKALEYVFHFTGDEEKLVQAVSKSVELSNIFLSVKGLDKVVVDESFIQIQLEHELSSSQNLKKKRIEKAEYFLNKYEEAAQITENFRKKVTINAIAFHSKPTVKPPAISSNIGNYKTEIRSLLATKKSKWTVLRTKFKPIRSLDSGMNFQ